MLLLRNKDQQQMNPLPSSERMTPGSWTWLLCSVCLTGKQTVIARIKSINRNCTADFMFSRKFWF